MRTQTVLREPDSDQLRPAGRLGRSMGELPPLHLEEHQAPSASLAPGQAGTTHQQITDLITTLQQASALEGLALQEYCWLATHGTERHVADRTLLFQEGEPVHHLTIVLAGEILVQRRRTGAVTSFLGRAGQITGKLPFSRMTAWGAEGYSSGPLWLLDLHEDLFASMLLAIPSMTQRCVWILLDRTRDFARADLEAEKLIALGKLAANLSHELKNPASAAERASLHLLSYLDEGEQFCRLGRAFRSAHELDQYVAWTQRAMQQESLRSDSAATIGSLSESDREDQVTAWLEAHHVPEAWNVSPALARSSLPLSALEELASLLGPDALPLAITLFAASLDARTMIRGISKSSARIFTIVTAIQDYSYMDQTAIQEVNLPRSLENSLALLPSGLAHLTILRDYDPNLPPLTGYGGELSQVWTALIENAIDAMQGRGILKVSTRLRGKMAFVEIWDNGPGVDPAIASRIFEPFFTTRPLGQGLGLGLDLVRRIVSKHFGSVTVESEPHATCFQVRLPLDRPLIY